MRATPVGPEESQDWLEALNASSNRFDTLERLARNQAQIINDVDARLVDHSNRLNDYANKLDKLNKGYIDNGANLREACKNIVDRYTTFEQSKALDEKSEHINAQVQAIMSSIASMNIPLSVDAPQPEFHNVGTPRNSDQQHPPEDAWAQYADAARARPLILLRHRHVRQHHQPQLPNPLLWIP